MIRTLLNLLFSSITTGSGGPFVSPPGPTPPQSGNSGTVGLLATTGPNGFALQNGTPNIISWTAPNDGQLHRVTVCVQLLVSVLEVGGQCNIAVGGTPNQLVAGGQAAGIHLMNGTIVSTFTVTPGQTVLINQATALTGGAAVLFAEIWGS